MLSDIHMLNFLVRTQHMILLQSHNQLVTMMSHKETQIFAIVNVGLQVQMIFYHNFLPNLP